MSEKVEIIITAKDAASQVLRGVAGNFGSIGSAVQLLTSGGAFEALTSAIVQFGKKSVEATVEYANEVRKLSQVSGQSAEETSRLIQLSDDFKISTGDLTVAMRKLTAEGLTLNVDTLAKLSDEYLRLNPGQERAAFLMEKFGRQGVKFAEIMQQGGASIRNLNDNIDSNLILTSDAITQAREYEKAMDSWGEQTDKLQYAIGVGLLPALTAMIDEANRRIDEGGIFDKRKLIPIIGFWFQLTDSWQGATNIIKNMQPEVTDLSNRFDEMNPIMKETNENLEQLAELEKEVSKANLETLSTIDQVAQAEKDYSETSVSLTQERMNIEAEYAAERKAGWKETSDRAMEYKGKIAELDAKVDENAKKHAEATQSIIADNLLKILSVDGLTTAELNQYLSVEVAMGRITEKDKAMAESQQALIDAFITGKIKADDLTAAIEMLPSGKSIDVILKILRQESDDYQPKPDPNKPPGYKDPKAAGGPVSAGEWYRVNETNQEYYRPSMSGSVIPMGGGGAGGVTVIINAATVIGDRAHLENYLLPVIREGIRQVGAGR